MYPNISALLLLVCNSLEDACMQLPQLLHSTYGTVPARSTVPWEFPILVSANF